MTEKPPMPDRQLTPATLDDVRESLAFALRYSRSGKRVADRDSLMASAAAEHLIEALERSGFVIMKRPPAPPHSAYTPTSGSSKVPPKGVL